MLNKLCQYSVTMLVIINFCMEFKAKCINLFQMKRTNRLTNCCILFSLLFSIVVQLSVVVAIDPEYELFNRIRQVDQAIVNVLGYFKNSETNNTINEYEDVTFWCAHR